MCWIRNTSPICRRRRDTDRAAPRNGVLYDGPVVACFSRIRMSLFRPIWQLLKAGHRWKRVQFAFSVWLQDPTLYSLDVHPVFDMDLVMATHE